MMIMIVIIQYLTCGKHLYDRIISLREEALAYETSFK